MSDGFENPPHGETLHPRTLPWSNAEHMLAYRKTLVESDGSGSQEDTLNRQRLDAFSTLLQRLPQDDLILATELYSLLATDDSESVREQVAEHTHCLYINDPEAGTDLFTCLVNDTGPSVRNYAFASVENACHKNKIPYANFKVLREIYYDACDREAIRDGMLKPRLITADKGPWTAQRAPWDISVETAVAYIADLESTQKNARELAAHEDFYTSLHHLPRENPALAAKLFTALAVHENRDIRARVPTVCALFLYAYDPQAAIDIARILQQDQDYIIAQSVKSIFSFAATRRGYDYKEILRLLDEPTPNSPGRPTLRLIQGGQSQNAT